MAAAIADNKPGDVVVVKFYRDNQLITKQVKLGTRPAAFDNQASPTPDNGSGTVVP